MIENSKEMGWWWSWGPYGDDKDDDRWRCELLESLDARGLEGRKANERKKDELQEAMIRANFWVSWYKGDILENLQISPIELRVLFFLWSLRQFQARYKNNVYGVRSSTQRYQNLEKQNLRKSPPKFSEIVNYPLLYPNELGPRRNSAHTMLAINRTCLAAKRA